MKATTEQQPLLGARRLHWIDIAKGLAIVLVVYRHVFEGIARAGLPAKEFSVLEHANILFFSFRMPLFFMVAGMFVAKSVAARGIRGFAAEKVSTILYPFLVWGILQISLQLLLSRYVNADRSFSSYIDLLIRPRRIDQFWYLLALFNTFLLFVWCRKLLRENARALVLLGFGLYYLSSLLNAYRIDTGLLYDVLHYFVFMAFGNYLGAWALGGGVAKVAGNISQLVGLAVVFIATQALFLFLNVEASDASYVEQKMPALYLLIATVGAFSIMVFSQLLSKSFLNRVLSGIGRYSLQVYVMHVLLASATRMVLVKFVGIQYVPFLLGAGIVVAIGGSVFLAKLSERVGWDWLYSGKWLFDTRNVKQAKNS